MYKNLKWLRLVPDKPGKGGRKTGYHTFQVSPVNDTREVRGWHVYRGRWRKDYTSVTIAGTSPDPGYKPVLALHGYVYPSLTDPSAAPSLTLLGHHLDGAGGSNRYWDFTNNTTRFTHSGNSIPATFLNIDGRCFAADGAREGMLMDDRTPAIHLQKNQNLGIGTPEQVLQGSTISAPYPFGLYGMAYVHLQSPFLTNPDPNAGLGTILVGEVVNPFIINPSYPYYAGTIPAMSGLWPAVPVANAVTSNTTPFTNTGTINCVNGSSIITLVGWTWPSIWRYAGLTITFAGKSYVLLDTYENTGGSNATFDLDGNAITLAAGQAILMGVYDGPTMTGVPYTITGCQLNMSVGTADLQMTNSAANTLGYGQATASRTVKIGVYVTPARNIGNLDWPANSGPQYAYAWYDPETGHMSNISPIYRVDDTYTPQTDITPVFEYGPGYISHPNGFGTPPTIANSDGVRFSHIVFFRTLSSGGSTLYPIGSLQPYIAKVHPGSASTRGSWNPEWMGLPNDYCSDQTSYPGTSWVDFSTDADLLLAGGFRAPQYTNEKPMVTIKGGATEAGKPAHMAYWDRRLWIVCTQDPDKVMFSCDEAQCPLGVPVESFPPQNYLRIPSVDGRVVGMKTVGEMLLVTTERWAYTVVGNNESNYRLVRISTRMNGVGTYQMSEMTSDVEGQATVVYFVGRDNIVYEWVVGGSVTSISEPVQDLLNQRITTLTKYQSLRLHAVSAWARRLLVLSFGSSILTPDVLIFDITNRIWTTHYTDDGTNQMLGPAAMTTIYGLNPPVNELWSGPTPLSTASYVRSWLRDDVNVQRVPTDNFICTFPLNFDGLKTRKQIAMVNLHMTSALYGTTECHIRVNEGPWIISTFTPFNDPLATNAYDPLESVYPPTITLAPVDSTNATDQIVMTAAFQSDSAAVVGWRFVIGIKTTSPTAGTTTPTEIYAIDIGYTEWQEPGEGDP